MTPSIPRQTGTKAASYYVLGVAPGGNQQIRPRFAPSENPQPWGDFLRTHLNNAEIISMPDKWEYPWYAAWDLAFHCIPLALIDAEFARSQLVLLTREWYMRPT